MSEQTKTTEKRRPRAAVGAPKEHPVRKKLGINLLDVILIIALILAVALVVSVYSPSGYRFGFGKEATLVYTIEVSGVPAEYASAINVDDPVYDADGYALGVVAADVEVQPYTVYEYKSDDEGNGSLVAVEHSDLKSLIITVSVKADYNEGEGYSVDGKRIAVGAEYELVLPAFESVGECVGLIAENAANGGE